MKSIRGKTYDIIEIGDYVFFDLCGEEMKEKVKSYDICFRKWGEEEIVYVKYRTEKDKFIIDCFCNEKWITYFENEYTHDFLTKKKKGGD